MFFRLFLIGLTVILLSAQDVRSQKTDTLYLKDGSWHIGEINSLQYGKLSYGTLYMGTANITWTNVIRLISNKNLTIQLGNGKTYHGTLATPIADKYLNIVLNEDSSTLIVGMNQVVSIVPVKRKKIYRLYGFMDLGFSYTKSSDVRQWNLGMNIGYRTDDYNLNLVANSINTFQGNIDRTTVKQDVRFIATRYLTSKLIVPLAVALEQNSELGIDLRTIIALGFGKYVLLRPRNQINIVVSPVFNNENYSNQDSTQSDQNSSQNTMEAQASLNWRAFNYSLPELTLTVNATYFYNLNKGNRNRFNSEIDLSYEIIDDFFITLNFYSNFDSNPPSETASNNDWGTTTKLRYSFKGGQRAKFKRKKKKNK